MCVCVPVLPMAAPVLMNPTRNMLKRTEIHTVAHLAMRVFFSTLLGWMIAGTEPFSVSCHRMQWYS